MHRITRFNRVIVGVATLSIIAACSTTTTPPADTPNVLAEEPTAPPAAASTGESAPPDAGTEAGSTAPAPAPVGAAEASRQAAEANAGKQFGGEEFGLTMEQLVERSEQVEALIGQCMADAGFEYFPVDFSTIRDAMTSDKSAPGLSGSEFVEQYGFGITTQFDKPIVELSLGEQNRRVLENLGEADRVAYLRTLFGEHADATYAYGLEAEDLSRTGGCTRQAVEQLFTADELSTSYFNPGDAIISQDPRALQAVEDWKACMIDGGIDTYSHPDDVEDDFQRRLDALTEAAGVGPEELAGADRAALQALQEEELRVAAVFVHCENTTLDPAMERVEAEYFGR